MATPHLQEGKVSIIDMSNWQVIKQIDTLGPGFFMRSHDNSPYAWVDVFFGPNKDAVHLIDKNTLEIAHTQTRTRQNCGPRRVYPGRTLRLAFPSGKMTVQ